LPRLQRAAAEAGLPLMEAAWSIPRTLAAASHGDWPDTAGVLHDHPVLIWDCDGILAFTAEALCGALNARFGTAYSPMSQAFFPGTLLAARLPGEQGAWISGLLRDASFLATFAPDFHAFDVLRDAYDAGFECQVVTERDPSVQDATAEWLGDWGAPAVEVHAVGHGNKPAFLAARYGSENPGLLIDDNPAVQISIARPGIEVWTPDRSYTPMMMRDHTRAFGSWQEARFWLGLGPQP
jgi:hypothetical protein